MNKQRLISGGLYLVVDPAAGPEAILPKVQAAIRGGVSVLQVWNHWRDDQDRLVMVRQLCDLGHAHHIPVIMHEDWRMLLSSEVDGVHFDVPPDDWSAIKSVIGRPFITGLTCSNQPGPIRWAIRENLDYLSFCSVFPSSSTITCELVSPQVIQQTRKETTMPIFAAGGVTPENTSTLLQLGVNGVAVISAIMKAEHPEQAARAFSDKLTLNTLP